MTQGGGKGFANVSREIFQDFLSYSFAFLACFKEIIFFGKLKCHITCKGEEGKDQCHK
jgi:hypothetical protein